MSNELKAVDVTANCPKCHNTKKHIYAKYGMYECPSCGAFHGLSEIEDWADRIGGKVIERKTRGGKRLQ